MESERIQNYLPHPQLLWGTSIHQYLGTIHSFPEPQVPTTNFFTKLQHRVEQRTFVQMLMNAFEQKINFRY